MQLYRETGQRKYLEPIPRALAYLRRSRLADGRFARFYELGTNKPLYFTQDYQLTYSDADVPTHYAFKIGDGTDKLASEYGRLSKMTPQQLQATSQASPPKLDAGSIEEVKRIIAAQDARGRWIEGGGLKYYRPKDDSISVIRSATFNKNVETLSRFLANVKP